MEAGNWPLINTLTMDCERPCKADLSFFVPDALSSPLLPSDGAIGGGIKQESCNLRDFSSSSNFCMSSGEICFGGLGSSPLDGSGSAGSSVPSGSSSCSSLGKKESLFRLFRSG